MEIETVNKLAEVLTSSGTKIVEAYTQWFIVSSIVWMTIGVCVCAGAKFIKFPDRDFFNDCGVGIRIIVFIIAVMMVAVNLVDLIAPEGMAIHQILSDLNQ